MKIGIISDTHDNLVNTEKVFAKLKEHNVSEVIHCGDFCGPFMMLELDKYDLPVHCVFGNIDDRFFTPQKVATTNNVKLYGDVADLEIGGKKIWVNHFPIFAEMAAKAGKHDAVFHGHTHLKYQKVIGNTLLANPGNIANIKHLPSYGVYDTETNSIEIFDL